MTKEFIVAAALMIVLGTPIFTIASIDFYGSTASSECWANPSGYRGFQCTPAAALEMFVMAASLACAVTGLGLLFFAIKQSLGQRNRKSTIT